MPRTKQGQSEADTPIRLDVVPRRSLRREDAARYVGVSTAKFDALSEADQTDRFADWL